MINIYNRAFACVKLDNTAKPCNAGFYTEHRFCGLLVFLQSDLSPKAQKTNYLAV